MAEVNPKAYPLADAQLTITILDIVQQAAVRTIRAGTPRSGFSWFARVSHAYAVLKFGKRAPFANDRLRSQSAKRALTDASLPMCS